MYMLITYGCTESRTCDGMRHIIVHTFLCICMCTFNGYSEQRARNQKRTCYASVHLGTFTR
ncbi:hypothetical protein KDW_06330 [Dictyobacter vulcani]|uniref:Uncharacterized protein n=1 Tax=Dictyobacter vulcani TaxID=2607529 RepID=A0A5J4KJY4_9CHLR|nr:hypothetical protein KDW_06330 [Dictyobacter vulcani]